MIADRQSFLRSNPKLSEHYESNITTKCCVPIIITAAW